MAKVPQIAIPIPVTVVLAQDFCSHTGRLAQRDIIPKNITKIPKSGWKVYGSVIVK